MLWAVNPNNLHNIRKNHGIVVDTLLEVYVLFSDDIVLRQNMLHNYKKQLIKRSAILLAGSWISADYFLIDVNDE